MTTATLERTQRRSARRRDPAADAAPAPTPYAPEDHPLRGMSDEEIRAKARRDAQGVLDVYWAPRVPPVDVASVADGLGVAAYRSLVPEDVLVFVAGRPGGADIHVAKHLPRLQERFACAHALGHYVLSARLLPPGRAYVDRRTRTEDTLDEVYCNAFATALLLPEAEVRAAVERGEDDARLARRLQVSLVTLADRRRTLGV